MTTATIPARHTRRVPTIVISAALGLAVGAGLTAGALAAFDDDPGIERPADSGPQDVVQKGRPY